MQKILIAISLIALSCTHSPQLTSPEKDTNEGPGQVSVVQTSTSETEAFFNIIRPRQRGFSYFVKPSHSTSKESIQVTKTKTIKPNLMHWHIDKVHVKGLTPNTEYKLQIIQEKYNWKADERVFRTLDLKKKKARFALGSCSSDAYSHAHVRDLIWDKMMAQNPDFLILTGDIVYVDSYDFVSRKKVTLHDMWQRYFDSIRQLKVFNSHKLIPLIAIWDDHDYGVNNADKYFPLRNEAKEIFQAFFGGVNIPEIYENSSFGVGKKVSAFGQNFLLMDNRSFREPSGSQKTYAHWGKKQHDWLVTELHQSKNPTWIIDGGQFFSEPFRVGKKQINEGLKADHPKNYEQLIKDLQSVKAPFVFASGDIHFSEILKIEKVFDFTTYELTSSPIHGFIFRPSSGRSDFWPNPRRIVAHKDYNYFLIESQVIDGGLNIHVESHGAKQDKPFFEKDLEVVRD